jgi:hypothetical protein
MQIDLDEKEIKQLALCYMNNDGENVYNAVIRGLKTWLKKKDYMIIPRLPKGIKATEGDQDLGEALS